jgi:hypothetical protein
MKDKLPYRALVLGTEGSGKTVFMASMYQYLSVQHPETGFYLSGTPIQHRRLIQAFQMIRDPDKPWPATTASVEEWNFTCQLRKQIENFPIFELTYYDYPGEVLTEDQSAGSTILQDFEHSVESADTWLVILDGERIKAWLDGDRDLPHRKTNIIQDLDFMLPYIQDHLRPTHFVITKWDLLDGEKNSEDSDLVLQKTRDFLMKTNHFNSIVNQLRGAGMPARLIPVSAVGKQFVTPTSDGKMIKNRGALPQPYQVEMPIVFTLLDAFHAHHLRLTNNQRKVLKRILSSTLWLKFVSDTELLRRLPFLPDSRLSRQALCLLVNMVEEGLSEKTLEELRNEKQESASRINSRAGAVKTMVLNYAVIAKRLFQNFPSSNLISKSQ